MLVLNVKPWAMKYLKLDGKCVWHADFNQANNSKYLNGMNMTPVDSTSIACRAYTLGRES